MKENAILTTKELSRYLKLNEKTIIKMAQTREIPGVKIGNQWRFYLSTVDEYLQNKIAQGAVYGFGKFIKTTDILPLSRLVDQSSIILNMRVNDQGAALHELAKVAYDSGVAFSADRLVIQLQKRENLLTTAVGNGVAIPHPRNPSDEIFKKPCVIIARSKKGINIGAPDDKKVHLFFLTCAPDVILHLKLLSKVAALLNTKDAYKKLMKASTKADIMKVIMKTEKMSINVQDEI